MKTRPSKSAAPAPRSTGWREPRVTRPGDALERDAERMADQALESSPGLVPGPAAPAGDMVMRQPTREFEEEDGFDIAAASRSSSPPPAPAGFLGAVQAAGQGQGLAPPVLARMEQGFGRSLGHVRVHDDAVSARLSDTIAARAFTHGQDVFFGRGEFRPGTDDGDRLLAHELAHTLQQPAAGTVARQPKKDPSQMTEAEKAEKRREIEEHTKSTLAELNDLYDKAPRDQKRPFAQMIAAVEAAIRNAGRIKDPRQRAVRLGHLQAERRLLDDPFYSWANRNDHVQIDRQALVDMGNPAVTFKPDHLEMTAAFTSVMQRGAKAYVALLVELWAYRKRDLIPKDLAPKDASATGAGTTGTTGTGAPTAGTTPPGGTGTTPPVTVIPPDDLKTLEEMSTELSEVSGELGIDDPVEVAARLKKLTPEQRKDFYAFARKMVQTSKAAQSQKGLAELLDLFNHLDTPSREALTINRKMEESPTAGEQEALPAKVLLKLKKDVKPAAEVAKNTRELRNNLEAIRLVTQDPAAKKEFAGTDLGILEKFADELAMLQGLLAGAARQSEISQKGGPLLMEEIWRFVRDLQNELQQALKESIALTGLTLITRGATAVALLNLLRRIKRIKAEIEKLREAYKIYTSIKAVVDLVSGLGSTVAKFRRWYATAAAAYAKLEAELEKIDSSEDIEALLEAQEERLLDEFEKILDGKFGAILEHLYIDESTSPEELQKILMNIPPGLTALGEMWAYYRAGNAKKDPDYTEVLAIKAAEAGMLLHPLVALVASTTAAALQRLFESRTTIGKTWDKLVPTSKRGPGLGKRNRGFFGRLRRKHYTLDPIKADDFLKKGEIELRKAIDDDEEGSGTSEHWAPAWFKDAVRREIKNVNAMAQFRKATIPADRKEKGKRGGAKTVRETIPLPRFRIRLLRPNPAKTTLEAELYLNPPKTIQVNRLTNADFRGNGIPYSHTQEKRKAALRKWLRDAGYQTPPHPTKPGQHFIRLPGGERGTRKRSYLHIAKDGRIKEGVDKEAHRDFLGITVHDSEDLPEGYYLQHTSMPAPPPRRGRPSPPPVDRVSIHRKDGLREKDHPQLGFDDKGRLRVGGSATAPPQVLMAPQMKWKTDPFTWQASLASMFAPRRGKPKLNLQGLNTRAAWDKEVAAKPQLKRRAASVQGRLGYTIRARAYGDDLKYRNLPELREEDDKGHLVARRFGGEEPYENLAPMLRRQNQNLSPGEWFDMEKDLAAVYTGRTARPGNYVEFQATLDYASQNTRRPSRFVVVTKERTAAGTLVRGGTKMRTIKND